MRKSIVLALLLLATPALAQQTVRQTGGVTPGHAAMWQTDGVIQDAGTAAQGSLTSLGTTGSGPAYCQKSGPVTAAYELLCLGVTSAGVASLTVTPFGGAPAPTLQFVVNGVAGIPVASIAPPGAATFIGNPTSGAVATPTAFTIQGLTAKASPDANNDFLVLWDNVAGSFKKVTPGQIAVVATSGVTSFGGVTGAITVGTGLTMTSSTLSNTGVLSLNGSTGALTAVTTLNGLNGALSITNGGGITVSPSGSNVALAGAILAPQGRITLQSGTPVMTASQDAKATVYYDCNKGGSQVPYWNGTIDQFDTIAACEVSLTMITGAATNSGDNTTTGGINNNDNYDVWWVHGGANRICLATSGASGHSGGGWTQDSGSPSLTARGTGYSQIDSTTRPYYTNKNTVTNCWNGSTQYGPVTANQGTYLGTIYTDTAGNTSFVYGGISAGGTASRLYVWNAYNQELFKTYVRDNTNNWLVLSNTSQALNGSVNNRVQFVIGIQRQFVSANIMATCGPITGSAVPNGVGVGYDVTSGFTGIAASNFSSNTVICTGEDQQQPLGKHFFQALDFNGASNAVTHYGNAGNSTWMQEGLMVDVAM